METKLAIDLISKTFSFPFNEENFKEIIIESLNGIESNEKIINLTNLPSNILEKTEAIKTVGKYNDKNGVGILVVVVTFKEKRYLEQTRNIQREIASKIMDSAGFDNILAAFIAKGHVNWRYSLIQRQYNREKTKSGRYAVKTQITELKRQSYLVGKNEPNHTAQKQMLPLLESNDSPTLEDMNKAFSVQNLTEEFFIKYRDLTYRLEDELKEIKKTTPNVKKTFEENFITEDVFAKKLMGQIVFLYFIQKKGWLGVKKDQDWGEGPVDFMQRLWNKDYCKYGNFFDDVLEPFFYNGLASKNKDNFYSQLGCKVPFLSGGLFEPINDYSWDESNITLSNDLIKNIFDTFNLYNFTIEEHQPLDVNVAIDPEMLGKVFENLLSTKHRKSLGAFYTPREIVKYMCQETLINYLYFEFSDEIIKDSIVLLINEKKLDENIRKKAKEIDEYLLDIKACDPAVGSGAFAVGLLNEIVATREILGESLNLSRSPYELKMDCIQNSIYGVDIDSSAVDITKLRLWLSLIVDENDYSLIHTLPNLSFKIMQGNALLEYFRGISLDFSPRKDEQLTLSLNVSKLDYQIENLHLNQDKHFRATTPDEIKIARENVEASIIKIFETVVDDDHFMSEERKRVFHKDLHDLTKGKKSRTFFPWKLYFADVFKEKGGFDIFISNPPYILEHKDKKPFEVLKDSPYYQGKMNYWYAFACISIDYLNNKGILSFIAPNNWITNAGASILRNKVIKETRILSLIDFGNYKVFNSPTRKIGQQTMVMNLSKSETPINYELDFFKLDGSDQEISETINLDNLFYWLRKSDSLSIKYMRSEFDRNYYLNNYITFSEKSVENILSKISSKTNFELTENDVKQGIDPCPDYLNKKMIETMGQNYRVGQGVFALKEDELTFLKLNDKELKLIKPYCSKAVSINRYTCNVENSEYLIYTDSKFKNKNSLDPFPNLKKHLNQFQNIITSDNKPYGLHRARDKNLFVGDRIISVRKCRKPTFTFVDFDCYFSSAFNIIKTSRIDLLFLTGLLNSKLINFWLYHKGKMQGSNYQIDKAPILKIPIRVPKKPELYINLVKQIIDFKSSQKSTLEIEHKLDNLIYQLYGLSNEEVQQLESVNLE